MFIFFCALFHVINGLRIVILDLLPEIDRIPARSHLGGMVCFSAHLQHRCYCHHPQRVGRLNDENYNQELLLYAGFNFDYLMWLFTRLSALAMYLLAIVGIIAALLMSARQNMTVADLMRWAFMPNPNHVINTNIPDIEAWKGIFWQVMGILMLFFAGAMDSTAC